MEMCENINRTFIESPLHQPIFAFKLDVTLDIYININLNFLFVMYLVLRYVEMFCVANNCQIKDPVQRYF